MTNQKNKYGGQIVLMKDGRIQQVGSPGDLYNFPANTFVAEFVGTPPMALIKAGLLKGINPSLTVGVRAENISIAKSSDSLLEARFLRLSSGSETQIGLEHNGITGLTVTVPGVSNRCVGEQLHIKFNEKDLHYFNQAGDRVANP